ncbi:MAG: DUF3300 domain-containing protein [Hyphomicrobiaceae bacterium]
MLFKRIVLYLTLVLSMTSAVVFSASAQQDANAKLSHEQLEQLVAPIALYPDSLLAQVLMASTYPLEIVQAARWSKTNPKVKGAALENAMQKQSWDASIKSLTAFPEVLRMMNEKLDWAHQLGDAFLAQQKDVLVAVQVLRRRAEEAGNLKSTEQQTVTKSTPSGSSTTYIVIEPKNPDVVYVPAYNPTVVYGTWPYSAYPPYAYYPPGYVAGRAVWFGVGVAVGAALWGNCNWRRNNVNINVNRYNQFNRSNIRNGRWQHNPSNRRGVPYGNRDVANRFGRSPQNARSREQFRGRAAAGRQQLSRPSTQRAARDAVSRGNAKRRDGSRSNAKRQAGSKRQTQRKAGSKRQTRRTKDRARTRTASRGKTQRRSPSKRKSANRSRSQRRSTPRRSSAYRGAGSGRQARRHSSRGRSSRGSFHGRGGSRGAGGFRGGGRGRGGGGRR